MMHDEKLEALVLGSIMTTREAINEVRSLLKPEMFYVKFHQEVYSAITEIDGRGERPDMMAVLMEMNKHGNMDAFRLSQITGNLSFDVYQHAAVVFDLYKRRSLLEFSMRLQSDAKDMTQDVVDLVQTATETLNSFYEGKVDDVSTLNDAIQGVQKQMSINASSSGGLTGTATGFKDFDRRSGGLQKSDLIIIAGESSQGKTSLAMSIALNCALNNSKLAIYSMEMKKEQIAARMMSIQSGVPANEILYSSLNAQQFDMIDRGVGSLYNRSVYFDDRSTSSIDTILNSIRSLKMKYDIEGAIIDYLQILNVNMKGTSKEQQMGDVARRLKNIAKELDIWVIALSQLSRDKDNPIPTVARLRDSGQINEAADITMLVYRPEYYGKTYPEPFFKASTQGTAMIDIGKGRNIGIFKFLCGFQKETTRFYDLDDVPEYRDPDSPF